MRKQITLMLLILCSTTISCTTADEPTKALIVTGQHLTHNWELSHQLLYEMLEGDGYDGDIALSPKQGEDMSTFTPDFNAYDLVVLDYNGDLWCEQMQNDFIAYVQAAEGGLVLYHAANTTFRDWEEYNKITALGAFGSRGEQTEGYYTVWKDDKLVKYEDRGVVGHHGKRHDFTVVCRSESHPAIDPTLPKEAIQPFDEIYDRTKGPANIKDVLYTAYSDTQTGGTGQDEVVVFTVDYHNARIFHSMIGHVCDSAEETPWVKDDTFKKIFLAGARWASGRE